MRRGIVTLPMRRTDRRPVNADAQGRGGRHGALHGGAGQRPRRDRARARGRRRPRRAQRLPRPGGRSRAGPRRGDRQRTGARSRAHRRRGLGGRPDRRRGLGRGQRLRPRARLERPPPHPLRAARPGPLDHAAADRRRLDLHRATTARSSASSSRRTRTSAPESRRGPARRSAAPARALGEEDRARRDHGTSRHPAPTPSGRPDHRIDVQIVSPNAIWAVQVGGQPDRPRGRARHDRRAPA